MANETHRAAGERLIVFTRFPEVGKVKTRLAAEIGAEEACAIHDRLARHAVAQSRTWGGALEIRVTGGSPAAWVDWLGAAGWREQGDGDLGARLERAFREAFAEGTARVVVTGTDCPALDAGVLREAFVALEEHEVVFGPAADGGYYLLGLTRLRPELFRGIGWGGSGVLQDSLAALGECQPALLRTLADVDQVEDLENGLRELEARESG